MRFRREKSKIYLLVTLWNLGPKTVTHLSYYYSSSSYSSAPVNLFLHWIIKLTHFQNVSNPKFQPQHKISHPNTKYCTQLKFCPWHNILPWTWSTFWPDPEFQPKPKSLSPTQNFAPDPKLCPWPKMSLPTQTFSPNPKIFHWLINLPQTQNFALDRKFHQQPKIFPSSNNTCADYLVI